MTDRNLGESAPVTRTEAILQAIDALGASAPVPKILDYVWEHFGIGVPPKPASPLVVSDPVPALELVSVQAATIEEPTRTNPDQEEPPSASEGADHSPARKGSNKRGRNKDRPSPE